MRDAIKSDHNHDRATADPLYAYVFLDDQGIERLMGLRAADGQTAPLVSFCRACLEGVKAHAEQIAATGVTVKFVEYRERTVLQVLGTAGQA